MKLSSARAWLFGIWALAFVLYVVLALCSTKFHEKGTISLEQSSEAAWKIAYVLVPVLSAFASFTFRTTKPPKDFKLPSFTVGVLFGLTAIAHIILILYFYLAIIHEGFDWPTKRADSFEGRIDSSLRWIF